MKQPEKRIKATFFKTPAGNEPVREWLKDLGKPDCTVIGGDIKTVELGWPIGMPTCRHMVGGIWEVRTNLDHRISRVLFGIEDGHMYLLHGFMKDTQQTPKEDLDLAIARWKEVKKCLAARKRAQDKA